MEDWKKRFWSPLNTYSPTAPTAHLHWASHDGLSMSARGLARFLDQLAHVMGIDLASMDGWAEPTELNLPVWKLGDGRTLEPVRQYMPARSWEEHYTRPASFILRVGVEIDGKMTTKIHHDYIHDVHVSLGQLSIALGESMPFPYAESDRIFMQQLLKLREAAQDACNEQEAMLFKVIPQEVKRWVRERAWMVGQL
jgi:hypothetical protein